MRSLFLSLSLSLGLAVTLHADQAVRPIPASDDALDQFLPTLTESVWRSLGVSVETVTTSRILVSGRDAQRLGHRVDDVDSILVPNPDPVLLKVGATLRPGDLFRSPADYATVLGQLASARGALKIGISTSDQAKRLAADIRRSNTFERAFLRSLNLSFGASQRPRFAAGAVVPFDEFRTDKVEFSWSVKMDTRALVSARAGERHSELKALATLRDLYQHVPSPERPVDCGAEGDGDIKRVRRCLALLGHIQ